MKNWKRIFVVTLWVLTSSFTLSYGQDSLYIDVSSELRDSEDTMHAYANKTAPWTALAEATAVNVFVQSFDRFVTAKDYAQTTLQDGINNIKNGFVWDNDRFSCNLLAHPYHGNLYFNSARENGLNFWQSVGYPVIGSLQWELFGEKEPPAINDFIATTFGGICIGEVLHRVSNTVLDDSQRGAGRFLRETMAFVLNPVKGVNRIVTGRAWTVSHENNLYYDRQRYPISGFATAGWRRLSDNKSVKSGEDMAFVDVLMEYGDVMNREECFRPYDYFNIEASVALSKNQPLINRVNILGRLWSSPLLHKRLCDMEFGLYQHFDYYDSEAVNGESSLPPYRISEAASLGPGLTVQFPVNGRVNHLDERLYANFILLGGTNTDHFKVLKRDYNMGSGYSIKSKTQIALHNIGRIVFNYRFYRLFTWKGYNEKTLASTDPLYVNSQGDKGSVSMLVVNPMIEIDLSPKCRLTLQDTRFRRLAHCKSFDDTSSRAHDLRIGITRHL